MARIPRIDRDGFALRLKAERVARGLTVEQLARVVDCSPACLRGHERGATVPNGDLLHRICLALGVRADTLLGLPLRPGAPMCGAVAA